jgi:dihydroxyacid dehydratase/phosphogluconate dehydratase
MAVRSIWKRGGLPFLQVHPAICDGIAQGHQGMRYSLLLRNLTTASLCATMEGHGYHAAFVLDSCDKRPSANVAALCQLDLQRKSDGRGPVFGVFLPSPVMREIRLPEKSRRVIRGAFGSLAEEERTELDDLFSRPVKCNTYAMWKKFADRCRERGRIGKRDRDRILATIAESTCISGGVCGFYGTGNTSRIMLAALGLVPRGMDILAAPAGAKQVDRAVGCLMRLIRRGDAARSVSSIVQANLDNAARVWAGTGGSTNWVLHLAYVAAAVGRKVSPEELGRISVRTPHIMRLDPSRALSMYTLAKESAKEGAGAIERIIHCVSNGKAIDLRASTVDDPWKARISGLSTPKSRILAPGGKPWRSSSGIVHVRGNIFDSAVVKVTGMTDEQFDRFDRKAYLVVFYLGEEKALPELFRGEPVLERLFRVASRRALLHTASLNGADAKGLPPARSPKKEIWSAMLERDLLRIMVVVAGEGPAVSGMPEMYYPSEYLARDPKLARITALCTDGRYSGATYGPCIGHAVPEAYRGGLIGALRTGDLVHVDLKRGRTDFVSRQGTTRSQSKRSRELERRGIAQSRIREMEAKRAHILPSVRPLLDVVDTAANGVCFRKGS